jgi:hypothetical protein
MDETDTRQAKGEIIPSKTAPEDTKGITISKNGKRIGRPPGAKNKDTLFKELMTGQFQEKAIEDIEKVYDVLFKKAHQGDLKAIKLVLDRVVPVSKAVDSEAVRGGVTVSISVGRMEDAQSVEIIEDAEFHEIDGE